MSLVRFRPEAPCAASAAAHYAGVAHLVERHLAKVEVAGSSPVARSIFYRSEDPPHRSGKQEPENPLPPPRAEGPWNGEVRQGSCKWPQAACGIPGSGFEPRRPLHFLSERRPAPFHFASNSRRPGPWVNTGLLVRICLWGKRNALPPDMAT